MAMVVLSNPVSCMPMPRFAPPVSRERCAGARQRARGATPAPLTRAPRPCPTKPPLQKDLHMSFPIPTGAQLDEAQAFLAAYPKVQAIDVVLSDLHGIGRGKIIRRHELEGLYTAGRGMPGTLFAQGIDGVDVTDALAQHAADGGDSRCWPVPGSLGFMPATGRGVVLVQMFGADGASYHSDPRGAMMAQVAR